MFKFIKDIFRKKYDDLGGAEFRKRFEALKGAVLLDVRTKDEFRSGTIPGALNMNVMSPDFASAAGKLDNSKTYFVFCRSGMRSARACSLLADMGYKVVNLRGGITAWPR